MTKCVCFNCRLNYNFSKGYFCSDGRFIPGVANTDNAVQAVAEDLRVKKGFDFGRFVRINDTAMEGDEFCYENPGPSNESAFSNQVDYGNEQSPSSQDYARNVESSLLMPLNSEKGQIQERTIGNLNNPALFNRSILNTPGSSSQRNERNSPVERGEKRFFCHVCYKRFKQNQHLKEHMFIHDGLKPYKCYICRKQFASRSNLIHHIRTHTGERPFSCKICGKKFNHSSNVNSHLRIHSNEKSFVCETCGKLFRRKSDLQSHAYTHTDEKSLS